MASSLGFFEIPVLVKRIIYSSCLFKVGIFVLTSMTS